MRPHSSRAEFFLGAIAAACVLLGTWGCSRRAAQGREVWAEVDGEPVYRDQVERIYRSRMEAGSDPGDHDQALSFELSILNELINNQILIAHATRSGISVSEAEIDTKIGELQSPYSKEEFQRKLKGQGLELSELRQEMRANLFVNKLINKEISSRIKVGDGEIAAYYQRNRATFNVPETKYHLAQIEVTPVADAEIRNLKNDDAKNPMSAERKIRALYASLMAGEDFATVAQEYSEDPSTATGGGDMGFVPASALVANPQLRQVVGSLKVGQISGIIQTPRGYHIIKLLGREDAGQYPLSDPRVQSAVRQTLMTEKEQLLKTSYIERLRNQAKVVNYLADRIVKGQPPTPVAK